VNQAYASSITLYGGAGAYSNLSVAGLPAGLSATISGNSIQITGTPTQVGTFNVTFELSLQGSTDVGVAVYSMTINPPVSLGNLSGTQWTENFASSQQLAVTGGTGGYARVSAGGLPSGLSAALSGNNVVLSGAPTQTGTFQVAISVQDSVGATSRQTYSLTVNPPIGLGSPSSASWTANQAGTSATVSISGGTGGYSNLTFSGLPSGLSAKLSGNTVTLSGTPLYSGSYNVVLSVQDSLGAVGTASFTLTIEHAASLTLTPATIPAATAGQSYSVSLGATGGDPVCTFALAPGSTLPAGLTLSSAGVLSGILTSARSYAFSIQASDPGIPGLTGTLGYDLTVNPGAPATLSVHASSSSVTAGTSFSVTITAADAYKNPCNNVSVTLNVGGQTSSVAISNGTGSTSVTLTKAQAYTLTASAGSVSATTSVTVTPAAPVITISGLPASMTVGQSATLTVTLADVYGNPYGNAAVSIGNSSTAYLNVVATTSRTDALGHVTLTLTAKKSGNVNGVPVTFTVSAGGVSKAFGTGVLPSYYVWTETCELVMSVTNPYNTFGQPVVVESTPFSAQGRTALLAQAAVKQLELNWESNYPQDEYEWDQTVVPSSSIVLAAGD